MMRYILVFLALLVSLLFYAVSVYAQANPPDKPPVSNDENRAFQTQLSTPLLAAAIEYETIERISPCQDEVSRNLYYHNCRDSRQIYEAGLAAARAQGKPLIIFFGFNRCPACTALHKLVFNPERPLRDANLVRYFSAQAIEAYGRGGAPLELPYITIHSRSKHGLKLADDIGATAIAKARGWHRVWSPFILFVDPMTGTLASEEYWDAPESHCDPIADFAGNLEALGLIEGGAPFRPRARCTH